MQELLRWSALEHARAIRDGELSSEEMTRFYLERVERINPQIMAFVTITPKRAMRAAKRADALRAANSVRHLPVFHGVPTAIKDLVPTRGIRTTLGSLWTVDTYIDGQAATNLNLADPATILLKLDGTVSSFSGCNTGGGTYVATDTEITFSDMFYTRVACPDATVAEAESYMVTVINNGTVTYTIDGKRLTVESRDVGVSATVK